MIYGRVGHKNRFLCVIYYNKNYFDNKRTCSTTLIALSDYFKDFLYGLKYIPVFRVFEFYLQSIFICLKSILFGYFSGGDEMVIKPFSTSDVKIEQVERSSPGPLKTPAGRKGAANVKAEIANGYGSPLSVTDENETGGAPASSAGLRGGAGGKRKGRGPAASSVAAKEREKRAKTAASTVQAVSATPASSTGGSSSEADASESENDVGNGASSGISNVGRPKKGAASALVAKEGKGRGRQRNSDSSSSSKEGLPVRKGRGGGGANAAAVAAAASGVTPGSTSKPGPVNPLSKPPIPHLKRTGESFLQVTF